MDLNNDNLQLYAAKHYTNVDCADMKEFLADLQRAQLAKKLIKRWQSGSQINLRLLLNHIIMFTNVFELKAAKQMLFFVCGDKQAAVVKTLLTYLNFIAQGEAPQIKYDLAMAKALKELANEHRY